MRSLGQGREVRDLTTDITSDAEGPIEVAMFDETGKLIGVGLYDSRRGRLRPDKVMAP